MAQFFKDSLHIVSRMTDSNKHVVPPRRQKKRLALCAASTYNIIDLLHSEPTKGSNGTHRQSGANGATWSHREERRCGVTLLFGTSAGFHPEWRAVISLQRSIATRSIWVSR